VIDGDECVPSPTPPVPVGAEFVLRLTGLSSVRPGAYGMRVSADPVDANLADGFHPRGQSQAVVLTVFPISFIVDSETLPLELSAGTTVALPVQIARAAGVGPVTVAASTATSSVGVSIDLNAEASDGTMTLSARRFAGSGTYTVNVQIQDADDGSLLRAQALPVHVSGLVVRPISFGELAKP